MKKEKLKAIDIINKFLYPNTATRIGFKVAKENSIILVNEIMVELNNINGNVDNRILFWENILSEIEYIQIQDIQLCSGI